MSDGSARRAGRGLAGGGHEPRLPERGSRVNTVWIVGGVAVVGAVIALVASLQRGGSRDLGTVSSQWISEHRLGSNQDYPRR